MGGGGPNPFACRAVVDVAAAAAALFLVGNAGGLGNERSRLLLLLIGRRATTVVAPAILGDGTATGMVVLVKAEH